MHLESGCLSEVPYAFIQPNGSWCWSNAGFIASVEGPGLLGGRFPWMEIEDAEKGQNRQL